MGVGSTPLVERHLFFPVSTGKFIVLSICSFVIYPLYWAYKNWQRVRDQRGERISPFWRAFFAPFFGFALFERVRNEAKRLALPVTWSVGALGTGYLVLNFAGALPMPYGLIGLLAFIPLIPVVRTIEQINTEVPAAEGRNESYSAANIATILIGGLILVVAVLGTLLFPETA
jgi:hypothetical protein